MRFSARSLSPFGVLALVLGSSVAAAQGAATASPLPPPPGGGATAPAASGGAPGTPPAAEKKSGDVGGYAYTDKPAERRAGTQTTGRRAPRRAGPQATFPGFEPLADGGSRLFVQLSQNVPVEERRAQGSVTYVLKGAHLRVNNDANALVTVHFNTPVFRARLTPTGNDLLFVLELRSAASPTFKVQDNPDKTSTLTIDFPKGDFLKGDGSEALPSAESKPTKGAKRAATTGNRRAPPEPEPDPGTTGPTP